MQKEFKATSSYNLAGFFFLVLFLCIPLAFYKTYFSIFPKFTAGVQNSAVIHFHAAVSFLWIVLLILQPMLIRYKKVRVHRLIGKFTYVLAPLLVLSFISLMVTFYRERGMSEQPFGEVLQHFYFEIAHTLIFSTFYILAVVNRKIIGRHAGYMIATGLIFINPMLRRVFTNGFNLSFTVAETIALLVTDLAVISLLLFARRRHLNYKLYYIILATFLVYQIPMFIMIYILYPGM